MTQEITYSGLSAQSSDYNSPDGSLSAAINLIPEDGALRPLLPPAEVYTIESNEELDGYNNVAYVHETSYFTHYILVGNLGKLAFINVIKGNPESFSSPIPIAPLEFIGKEILKVCALGNTLEVLTPTGIYYLLWQDSEYVYLGDHVPEVHLAFGLRGLWQTEGNRADQVVMLPEEIKGTFDYTAAFSTANMDVINDAIWARHDLLIANHCNQKGKFAYPFFVRYAIRLYDDSLIHHSAPVLMITNSRGPIVSVGSLNFNGFDTAVTGVNMYVSMISAALEYQVLQSTEATFLNRWSDLIKSIDIFVSPQIYPILTDEKFDAKPLTPTNFRNGKFVGRLLYKDGNRFQGSFGSENNGPFGHWNEWSYDTIYRALMNINRTLPATFVTKELTTKQFKDKVAALSEFRFFTSIEVNDIISHWRNNTIQTFSFDDKNPNDLSNLRTREAMTDDYLSHDSIIASDVTAYNNQLNLSDIKLKPFQGFLARELFPMCNATVNVTYNGTIMNLTSAENNGYNGFGYKITVFLEENGMKYSVSNIDDPDVQYGEHGLRALLSKAFTSGKYETLGWGSFVFYPNRNAKKILIECTNGESFLYGLEEHPHLNGAYCFLGLDNIRKLNYSDNDLPANDSNWQGVLPYPNKIFLSEVNNPFLFLATGRNTLGSAQNLEILATATAAKALSQGQFGQFPLYAFTDQGVWAMEVGADGSYIARQPITRDVCINPAGITQIDSAVLFPTDRGIMLLSGSDCTCISDTIRTETPFDLSILPGATKLHSRLSHGDDICLSPLPFTEFLKNCRMIYDYVHQRIIVYNTLDSINYAYVYSMKSKLWGMMYTDVRDNINSYPNALAITTDGNLVDFTKEPNNEKLPIANSQLLITRPLSFGSPDILKTVSTVIQRGDFPHGHVATVLYGSRDLRNWHLVWSSRDHRLRGFRGTPYKYFRLAALCSLTSGESLSGASVDVTPRQTNQLR